MSSTESSQRLVSLDAYRGFVMLAMASSGLGVGRVAEKFKDSPLWQAAAYQLEHVAWGGCSAWDLIQPSFMFIVGVAIPFSFAHRVGKGDGYGRILRHSVVRSFILIALGVILYSGGRNQTNFIFTNVLAQIGLGYTFVFLLLNLGWTAQTVAVVAILAGSWYLCFQHPIPTAEEIAALNLPRDWRQFEGLAAHWNKHTNFFAAFDRWFLNLFPREVPFKFEPGGYQTLNFLPSAANMTIGLMAGRWLMRESSPAVKRNGLLLAGVLLVVAALALDHTAWPTSLPPVEEAHGSAQTAGYEGIPFSSRQWTVCPAVKKIWTPTFAILSAGWTLLSLALFFWVVDERGRRAWAFPLVVVGMNSIAVYLLSQLTAGWLFRTIKTHAGTIQSKLGTDFFGGTYGPIVERCSVLLALWLIAYWLYRQRIFFRI